MTKRTAEHSFTLAAIAGLERAVDRVKSGIRRRLGWSRAPLVQAYRGYGSDRKLQLKGRVVEDRGLVPAQTADSVFRNFAAAYKRFQSDEIPGARVRVSFGTLSVEALADDEGYFAAVLELKQAVPPLQSWHEVEIELIEPPPPHGSRMQARGEVLVPLPSDFGIISDIDDTIVRSYATSALRLLWLTLFRNARTRLPFDGASAFYRALERGPGGKSSNPFFYVSGSPWNLYDALVDFMQVNDLPVGPLLLRDFGIGDTHLLHPPNRAHKLSEIRNILDTYPGLRFILIGDSGEEDPEIYADIAEQCPARVAAIYIRDVTTERRREQVRRIAAGLKRHGVHMLLMDDAEGPARHAAASGYIVGGAVGAVRTEKATGNDPAAA